MLLTLPGLQPVPLPHYSDWLQFGSPRYSTRLDPDLSLRVVPTSIWTLTQLSLGLAANRLTLATRQTAQALVRNKNEMTGALWKKAIHFAEDLVF